MHILLINPGFPYIGKDTFPLGLSYIAAIALQDHHKVCIIDENKHVKIPWNDLKQYELIGFSFTTPAFTQSQKLIQNIRNAKKPETLIIAGGHHPTFRPEEVINAGIDVIFRGEADFSFRDFLRAIQTQQSWTSISGLSYKILNGEFQHNPLPILNQELDKLPYPARALFPFQDYLPMSIITSRGCPYMCSYCAAAAFWQHSIRQRSVPNIIQEIKETLALFPFEEIKFQDSVFTMKKDRTQALLLALIENNFHFQWMCETRADCLDADLIRLMKQAHCKSIMLGFESGSPELLARNNRYMDMDTFIAVSHQIKDAGIGLRVSVIFGLPGESEESVMKTVAILRQIQPNVTFLNLATSYPGCELENARSTEHNSIWLKNFGGHGIGGKIILPDGMNPAQYRKLATLMQKEIDTLNRIHWGK